MTDFLKFVVIAGLLILSLPQARAENYIRCRDRRRKIKRRTNMTVSSLWTELGNRFRLIVLRTLIDAMWVGLTAITRLGKGDVDTEGTANTRRSAAVTITVGSVVLLIDFSSVMADSESTKADV